MGTITKTSIIVFLVVLTISSSYYNVLGGSVVEPAESGLCLFKCEGVFDDHACFHDCSGKVGYKNGYCVGNPPRCCCTHH
ncbi:PREDICTED: defensin-like protein 54 [Camelina sativa]|uniref:Defensin-like protein 54 n=1 Tax=Camelina sativa TaxID=90675 RepID=A0ABM0Z002_CAMSA|nr:PREDICTED: defensin-like protein 54 [Camelina sativa]